MGGIYENEGIAVLVGENVGSGVIVLVSVGVAVIVGVHVGGRNLEKVGVGDRFVNCCGEQLTINRGKNTRNRVSLIVVFIFRNI
jgi:hypothetical protein